MARTVRVDLGPLKKFEAVIKGDLRTSSTGPIRKAMKKWAARFRGYIQKRFDKYSKGGGDWPPLAESTKRGRRAGKKGPRTKGGRKGKKGAVSGVFAILADTGMMKGALDPVWSGKPGALQQDIPMGIRVGYGGPAKHSSADLTIATLVEIHQEGKGNVPEREIIVDPDQTTTDGMGRDMQQGLNELLVSVGRAKGSI